jgi:hypothetical protein
MEKAARLYQELDGKVDAFGVGGADLGLQVDQLWYPLYSVRPMVRFIQQTPVVDGAGLKNTLEAQLGHFVEEHLGHFIDPKTALITSGADRWGMTRSFLDVGFACVFGDLMFGLGIPLPIRSERAIKILAALVMPIVGRLPFEWIYPTGEKQEHREPKFVGYYEWASVVAGDCHYVKRHMPERMQGKVIVTNTTTPEDISLFRSVGVSYLVTSTPVLEGRSFGTNMMEAALIAVSGKKRPLTHPELSQIIEDLGLRPQLQRLN